MSQYGPVLLRRHYFDLQARAYAALVGDEFDLTSAAKLLQIISEDQGATRHDIQ